MRRSAVNAYVKSGGVHLPISSNPILSKAIQNQIEYADNWKKDFSSGKVLTLDPLRAAMYPREAHHIGSVVGQQIAMSERGARKWRRVLHPESSKEGPCADCTADAEVTHSIEEPFFEFHPNGVCGLQTLVYSTGTTELEAPVPYSETPTEFLKHVARHLGESVKSLVRRIMRR